MVSAVEWIGEGTQGVFAGNGGFLVNAVSSAYGYTKWATPHQAPVGQCIVCQ